MTVPLPDNKPQPEQGRRRKKMKEMGGDKKRGREEAKPLQRRKPERKKKKRKKKEAHQSESVNHRKLHKVSAIAAPVQNQQTQGPPRRSQQLHVHQLHPTQGVCHRSEQ